MNLSKFPSQNDIYIVDDSLCDQLQELTEGDVSSCYQCGVCTAVCPWGLFGGESLSVRALIRSAQIGIQDQNENLWLCTTCGQCNAYCPRGVDVAKIIRALRLLAWDAHTVQAGLPSLLWSIYWNNNPWSQPPSQRENWIGSQHVPLFDPDHHEILLYIGCTSSYDRRAQKIALALVEIFHESAVKYGYLGENEPCCGESALSVGHLPYFHEIVLNNTKLFRDRGVRDVVTVSPHCYDVFKNHYPAVDGWIKPIHYTEYVEKLISDGRLSFSTTIGKRVTYQDPCYLGRHNKVYDAPRTVINAIPGIELIEMTEVGIDGLCCGGGGGRMWLETKAGERFSDSRVQQALETNADTLITACPFCVVCLEDSLKSIPECEMQVLDVAELVVLAL